MIRNTFLTLAALSIGSAALADCPQSMADTGDGVFVSFDNFYVRYDRLADGSVLEQEVYLEDGGGFRVHSISGAFVLQSWDTSHGAIVNNSSEVTSYAVGVENLPTLFPGLTWQGSTVRRHDDGTVNVETVDVLMEPESTITLGACSYPSWPIRVTTTGEDGGAFVDRLTYLPSLGFAIYHGGADAGELFVADTPLAISTEPPTVDENGRMIAVAGGGVIAGNPTPAPAPVPAPATPNPSK